MFRSVFRFFFLLSLAGSASLSLSAATELRLRNGDILRGEHLKTENGVIYFKSPVLGTILIPSTEAQVAEVPDTPVESLVGLPPTQPGAKPASSTDATATKPAKGEQPAAVASKPPPAPSTAPAKTASADAPKQKRWKGKLEFGYQQQSGRRDVLSGSLRIDLENNAQTANLYKASARALYGKQNDQVNSERYEGSFRWRHEFGERMFTQTLSSYLSDQVKNIDNSFEQNAGLGYRIFQHQRHVLNAGLGATAQYRQVEGITEDVVYLSEFFQDYSYKINGRLSLLQESNILYSTNPIVQGSQTTENYRIRFNTSLQGRVSNRVSLNIRYEFEYDNSVADPELRTDQRITSSIGYAL